jgi:hypothetical protein
MIFKKCSKIDPRPKVREGPIMDGALLVAVELTESMWQGFSRDLEDMTAEEVAWRPLPEANSISLIVRHLSIEAEWHLACLQRGAAMPHETTEHLQGEIDSVPLNFEQNLNSLEQAYTAFLAALRTITLNDLEQRTAAAYEHWGSFPPHFLGFHQAMHLAMHWGQVRTIRNLYRKTRGEPARFFPDNPTYPKRPHAQDSRSRS